MRADPPDIEALFHRARLFGPAERAAFLAGACGEDLSLRKRIEALLDAHEQAEGFLPEGAQAEPIATVIAESQPQEEAGLLIGRYKLLERLGEGGFGAVWLAEQREPVRRKVALKIIKLGMDTRQVVARFEAERQALALMDHPNIAKVLDAGTTDAGRPYFVMELVRGVAITRFCDENSLPTEDRLDLFIRVCQAIQHAHQKGIIHRDIKPSNILVTLHDGVPVPKVIDFGIAKATQGELTDKTIHTQFQQFIGTPAYMSPEQAEMSGLDIDTRSDIYSLGVLLYELLTGKTPFDSQELLLSGLVEMRRTIREKEPVRPSTRLDSLRGDERTTAAKRRGVDPARLGHLLRGDLDWIVMKCLEKDRSRRYETANGLAMDLKRHLSSELVLARPPTAFYRLQKLVRRNRLAFTAGLALLGVLLLGSVVSTLQAVRASRAERAQHRLFQEAEAARIQESSLRQQADGARREAVSAQSQAQQNLYAANMVLAFQALEKGNLGRLRELLGKYAKPRGNEDPLVFHNRDLRGWEWRHLSGRCQGDDLFTLRGHTTAVPVALFVDNQTAISAGQDFTLKFWDLETHRVIESIHWSERPRRAAVSPDGRLIAIGGDFSRWSLWDAASRKLLLDRTNQSGLPGVTFSPQGGRLALADGDNVEVWDTAARQKIKEFPRRETNQWANGFVFGLAFTPDGRKLAYAHAGSTIMLHDLESGTERMLGRSSGSDAYSLAISPNGQVLASGDQNGLSVWDMAGAAPARHLTNHLEQVVCVAFSPDGQLLASASGDQTIKLWDTRDWQEIATLRGHEHEVHSVSFSPDGKHLISSSKDETVRVWNAAPPARSRDRFAWPVFALFAPHRSTANLWCWQPKDKAVAIFDLARLTLRWSEPVPDRFFEAQAYWGIGPNGDRMAIGTKAGPIELWSTMPYAKLSTVATSSIPATCLALGETGRWLAVQRTNEMTEIWDIQENRLAHTFPPLPAPVVADHEYSGLAFWAGDRCLTRATSIRAQFIDVVLLPSGERHLIKHTHKDDVANFAISDDGTLLATAAWDAQVKLWDTHSGRELATLPGQLVGFLGLAFAPDNTRLAAGGWDGSITLWDVRTRLQVGNWKAHALACNWLSFIDGGRTLASAGRQSATDDRPEMRLWRAPSWAELDAADRTDQPR